MYRFQNAHFSIELYNAHRPHNDTALYGYTQFSDLTEHEFTENHLLKPIEHKHSKTKPKSRSKSKKNHSSEENRPRRQLTMNGLPLKIDW